MLSVLVVFMVLAALYESWSIPFAVMLVVPLGLLGAVLAVSVTNMTNDVFFKVGLITLIGLSAKNAILIIEFARQLMKEGKSLIDATLTAAKLRLRPRKTSRSKPRRAAAPRVFPPVARMRSRA